MSTDDAVSTAWNGLHNPALTVDQADLVVLGLPFDGAASFRKGAAEAPERIRNISTHIPPTTEEGKLLTGLRVLDLGDIEPSAGCQQDYFDEIEAAAAGLFGRTIPFFIGGDHSVSIPLLRAAGRVFQEKIGIIYFDAHLDLCAALGGNNFSHGCTCRRALECAPFDLQDIFFIGTRSFELQELHFLKGKAAHIYTAGALTRDGLSRAAAEISSCLAPFKYVYISLDIDFLDPAVAPGTGTPKPGGFTSRDLLDLLKVFSRLPVIGMDLVEVAPPLDQNDITSFAAQRAITEMWGFLFAGRQPSG
ncbi:MAG: agmatinase [Bacillota bacterium]